MSYFYFFGETTAQKLASDLSIDNINIYTSLNTLIKLGYVERYKPNTVSSIYSIYHLSETGLDYIRIILK